MSRFFSSKYASLVPYTPGEQPQNRAYIKLNTNESPFPPSPLAQKYAAEAAKNLQLYSDPECRSLIQAAVKALGIGAEEIIFTNGSDDILNFAFMAFCDENHPAAFPDITYGFYSVFADLNHVPYTRIPLKEDFTVDAADYLGIHSTIFIANPNAPTGIALKRQEIERILESNPDNVVVVDEAYVDFGGESCVGLIHRYPNLLVTRTFSKSRSLAGGRLGFGIACPELIRDLNTIRFSTNPYNINRMTMAAGVGALEDEDYFRECTAKIVENREFTGSALKNRGFTVLDSKANFVFAKHPAMSGLDLYRSLKEKGILVRHFETSRLKDFNRITIGSREQMEALLAAIDELTEG